MQKTTRIKVLVYTNVCMYVCIRIDPSYLLVRITGGKLNLLHTFSWVARSQTDWLTVQITTDYDSSITNNYYDGLHNCYNGLHEVQKKKGLVNTTNSRVRILTTHFWVKLGQ